MLTPECGMGCGRPSVIVEDIGLGPWLEFSTRMCKIPFRLCWRCYLVKVGLGWIR